MHSTNFHIEAIDKGNILVVPTNYLRPEKFMGEIEEVLNTYFNNIEYIYFDFLIKNGTNDRFFKAKVLKNKIARNSFSKTIVTGYLEEKSNIFFSKNINLINNSYLSKAQKFLLKRKLSDLAV